MRRSAQANLLTVVLLALPFCAACLRIATGAGSFDRTLKVSGPLRLEIRTGSGNVTVNQGPAGAARIHAEMSIHTPPWESPGQRIKDLEANPPIEQRGDTILVGFDNVRMRNVRISYTITVPAETELRATTGSGSIEVRELRGPVQLSTGSGAIDARKIGNDTEVNAGSGQIHLIDVAGAARASTGSGGIHLENIRGDVRAGTGSGSITIEDAAGRLTAKTGSGTVRVTGGAGDLDLTSSSGRIEVEGNPAAKSFWELHSGSGGITLDVPDSASFRLEARTNGGRIRTDLPLTIEEQSRRTLRGRVGKGDARVEARTRSGGIHIL